MVTMGYFTKKKIKRIRMHNNISFKEYDKAFPSPILVTLESLSVSKLYSMKW